MNLRLGQFGATCGTIYGLGARSGLEMFIQTHITDYVATQRGH